MSWLKALRSLMFFISIFHLAARLGLMFSIEFQEVATTLYGAHLEWTATNIYFLRIIGAFAFVLGFLAMAAVRNPLKNRVIVISFIVFFAIRNINRHLYSSELFEGLSVTPLVNNLTTGFFGIQATLLAALLWLAARRASKDSE